MSAVRNYTIHLHVPKERYETREQLYALCVLLGWPHGLSMSESPVMAHTVTLLGEEKGNTGHSGYLLETATNATTVDYTNSPHIPYQSIYFKVLGIQLEVVFDEDGVGTVTFPKEDPEQH